MKKYILVLASILLSATAMSQVTVSYSAGFGTNNMDDLKEILTQKLEVVNTTLGNASIGDNFANPLIHTLEVSYTYHNEEFGIQLTFMNTKGTIEYAEGAFMGGYADEYKLSGFRIGTIYRRSFAQLPLGEKRKAVFFGEIGPGLLISKLSFAGYVPIINGIDNSGTDNSKLIVSVVPMVGAKMNITDKLGVKVSAGYFLGLGGKLDDPKQSKMDWSGLRANAGLYYTF